MRRYDKVQDPLVSCGVAKVGQDFRDANLHAMDLRDAKIPDADPRDAKIRDARARDADLPRRQSPRRGFSRREDSRRFCSQRGFSRRQCPRRLSPQCQCPLPPTHPPSRPPTHPPMHKPNMASCDTDCRGAGSHDTDVHDASRRRMPTSMPHMQQQRSCSVADRQQLLCTMHAAPPTPNAEASKLRRRHRSRDPAADLYTQPPRRTARHRQRQQAAHDAKMAQVASFRAFRSIPPPQHGWHRRFPSLSQAPRPQPLRHRQPPTHGTSRHGMTSNDMTSNDMASHDMLRYDMIRDDMI